MDVISPNIGNPNGDRTTTLLDALAAQVEALESAMTIMSQSRPNARNYYETPGRYESADDQQSQRIAIIKNVQVSLCAELDAILEQQHQRR